jgi:hypothetical protein
MIVYAENIAMMKEAAQYQKTIRRSCGFLVDAASIVVEVFSEEPETPQKGSAKTRLVRRQRPPSLSLASTCSSLLSPHFEL